MRPFLKILIILSTQVSTYLHSQNLVNNGSFEHLVDCFDRCGEWFEYQPNLIAKYWTSATTGDPDVFSPCNYGVAGNYICTPYYVPKNIYGFQFAKEGQNYAGFAAGASYLSNPQSYSQFAYEYLSNNLIQQLENKKYCITLSVSIASGYEPQFPNITNSSLYAFLALRQLEIFFTKEKFFVPIAFEKLNNRFDVTFKSERDTFFRDTLNWETLSMPYLARGDERFMTIGNFSPDTQKYHFETNMSQAQLDSFPGTDAAALSYVYIDDISLVEIPELEAKADTNSIYKGNSVWLYSPTQAEEYTWFAGDTLNKIGSGDSLRVNPTETTRYYLKALQCKLTTYDTVTITVLPAPLIPVNISVVNTLTNTDFTIKYTGDNRPELQAELFNSVGQIVRRFVFTETINVGISDLATGIYYCRIRKDNVPVLTQKIVKMR